ncbi:MAG: glutathione peroxidase [Propionibacteriaceae bacterium]|jgi:glutathione peroxidase|nr:glutathione peroxidase [Propionibacteriaceae bacterium]
MTNFFNLTVQSAAGEAITLGDFRGQVILVVNTATGCGFTPQYAGLEELHQRFRDQGLVILDFPCNQFGHQAPGSDAEIVEFCQLRYHTTFPQMAKIDVKGPDESPVYSWLKSQKGGLFGGKIKWNFTKFLIDRSGAVVERYAPATTPAAMAGRITELIEA